MHHFFKFRRGDQEACPAVFEDIVEFLFFEKIVDWNDNRSDLGDRQYGDDKLPAVAQKQRHPILGLDTQRGKITGKRIGTLEQLPVGNFLSTDKQCCLLALFVPMALDHLIKVIKPIVQHHVPSNAYSSRISSGQRLSSIVSRINGMSSILGSFIMRRNPSQPISPFPNEW